MKMFSLILGLLLLVATSGCMRPGMTGGRGSMMAGGGYGSSGYGSPTGYGSPMGYGSGGYGTGPMVGAPMATRYVRGAASPLGGSSLHGSGYVSPEAVVAADSAYQAWATAPVPTGAATVPVPPCTSGSCPTSVGAAPVAPLVERFDMLEDQVLDHIAAEETPPTH
ncbi:hypothetical protein K8R04_03980 [Candidatus Uhrbacteria bacterium]|nr:hypothetical protein [Candidatus Uhrbacteria bacterium]